MATYNCSGNANSAYGANGYGTCADHSVGAPNTGIFQQVVNGGSFTIIAPLIAAVVVVVIAAFIMRRHKKA